MSQENVEIAKRVYGAFAAGGVEALVPMFTPDAVIYPFPEWVEQSVYRGHDGLRAIFAVWTSNFDNFKLEMYEVREVEDRVLALGEMSGRIKASGAPIRQPLGIVYTEFRAGLIREAHNFITWQQAFEAVGLSE